MMNSGIRPGIFRANLYYLIAGAGLVLLNLLAPYIVDAVMGLGLDPGYTDLLLIVDALYYVPCMLIPVCVHAARNESGGLRLGPVSFGQMILAMLLAYLCVLLANSLGGLWSILLESVGLTLYSVDVDINGTADLLKAILAMAVLPGICEELMFRGTVLTAYERGGTHRAIVISSVLFAVLHGSVQGFPVQLAIGFVLGYVACYTSSLYTSMMLHTAYNAFILMISYFTPETGAVAGDTLFEQIGGMFGVGVLVAEGVVMGLLIIVILKSFIRKGIEEGVPIAPKTGFRMDTAAIAVLISGIVTVGYMYLQDIIALLE